MVRTCEYGVGERGYQAKLEELESRAQFGDLFNVKVFDQVWGAIVLDGLGRHGGEHRKPLPVVSPHAD